MAKLKNPDWECRFIIEDRWTDKEGDILYKVRESWDHFLYEKIKATTWYLLIKINRSGEVMESVASMSNYAEDISPTAGWYKIHYRQ
jgi:hypothetical protein